MARELVCVTKGKLWCAQITLHLHSKIGKSIHRKKFSLECQYVYRGRVGNIISVVSVSRGRTWPLPGSLMRQLNHRLRLWTACRKQAASALLPVDEYNSTPPRMRVYVYRWSQLLNAAWTLTHNNNHHWHRTLCKSTRTDDNPVCLFQYPYPHFSLDLFSTLWPNQSTILNFSPPQRDGEIC